MLISFIFVSTWLLTILDYFYFKMYLNYNQKKVK